MSGSLLFQGNYLCCVVFLSVIETAVSFFSFQQEMSLPSHKSKPVVDESLENWRSVGSGGFGRVYQVRHKGWGQDVAIKIPQDGVW